MDNAEKNLDDILTLKQMLENNSKRYAIRKAFFLKEENGEEKYISYRKFYTHTRRLSYALRELLGEGKKKIALCMKNCYEWSLSYFAISYGAGTVVPLDKDIPFDEFVNSVEFAGIDAVIADKSVTAKLTASLEKLPKDFKIITTSSLPVEGTVSFSSLLEKGKSIIENETFTEVPIDPYAPAFLLFTSGTTGMAKAVELSNYNICSDITGVRDLIDINYDDSTLCTLPLHHTYQTIVMLVMLYIGGCVSFSESLRRVSDDMVFFRPTVFASVPLLLEKTHSKIIDQLNKQKIFKKSITVGKVSSLLSRISRTELKKHTYSLIHNAFGGNLRIIFTGAAAINEDIVRDYEAFGFKVVIGYGLTECSPIVICNSTQNPLPDSIGKPINGAEAMIDSPSPDGIGEICVKGPMVMLGYYNDKKATDEAIKDGWFHTGDLGYIDDNMNYHITGRIKNVIIAKNGKNVYPEELEYYLNRDPMVLESLIFSDDDENEQVTASVVPDEEAIKNELQKDKLTREDIQNVILQAVRRINRALPSYKNIRKVRIREDELEKTSTSKIRRNSKKNKEKTNDISTENAGEN